MTLAETISLVYAAMLTRHTRDEADLATAMIIAAIVADEEEENPEAQ